MESTMYKVLKDWGDHKEGEVVSSENLVDVNVDELVTDGTLEVMAVDGELPSAPSTPDASAPTTSEESASAPTSDPETPADAPAA